MLTVTSEKSLLGQEALGSPEGSPDLGWVSKEGFWGPRGLSWEGRGG